MFDVIPSRLVGVFLMFGFEWSLLVKIIYGLGGSVYNLNNVPLDVDPKCIFVVQIYYRVFFLNESVKNRDFFFCLCLVLGMGLVALLHLAWNCMKFSPNHQFHFSRRCQVFFLFFESKWGKKRCISMTGRPAYETPFLFWFHILFKALKRLYIFW